MGGDAPLIVDQCTSGGMPPTGAPTTWTCAGCRQMQRVRLARRRRSTCRAGTERLGARGPGHWARGVTGAREGERAKKRESERERESARAKGGHSHGRTFGRRCATRSSEVNTPTPPADPPCMQRAQWRARRQPRSSSLTHACTAGPFVVSKTPALRPVPCPRATRHARLTQEGQAAPRCLNKGARRRTAQTTVLPVVFIANEAER